MSTDKDFLDKFWDKNGECVIEGLKELARYILVFLVIALLDLLPVLNLSPIEMAVLASVLRGLDKFIHKKGKETGNESLTRGLTRF